MSPPINLDEWLWELGWEWSSEDKLYWRYAEASYPKRDSEEKITDWVWRTERMTLTPWEVEHLWVEHLHHRDNPWEEIRDSEEGEGELCPI